MLLAIDTATRFMSLALHDGHALIAEQSMRIGNHHTTMLTPSITAMMDACAVKIDDLSSLAVSTGPGSFTGLRIGVAMAKGLAAYHALPLIGVSALDTLAAGQPQFETGHALVAVVQAGRGRVIVKSYRWRKGHWVSRAEPRLMHWSDLIAEIDGSAYISGEIDDRGRDAITDAQNAGVPVKLAPPVARLRRAGYLAQVAWEQLHAADDWSVFPASKVTPVYIKTESSP